ncbi:MAG: SRPBCC family protein [Pseudomonadota bacterium]
MTIDPIVKTVRVPLRPVDAFALFTEKIGAWWPVESHSVSAGQGAPSRSLSLEGKMGGALIEIGHDGTQHNWGTVEEWEPGHVFATTWHPGKMADRQTRVRVTFEADGDGTLVTLTHWGWDALGNDAAAMRTGYDGGWNGVLERFVGAI